MHDCSVWNDDDSFCVKDGSENMLFERIRSSGLGLTIGSIGNSVVRNITFRDVYMYKTYKGIYMKVWIRIRIRIRIRIAHGDGRGGESERRRETRSPVRAFPTHTKHICTHTTHARAACCGGKFRSDGGSVSDILYENIVMDEPTQVR